MPILRLSWLFSWLSGHKASSQGSYFILSWIEETSLISLYLAQECSWYRAYSAFFSSFISFPFLVPSNYSHSVFHSSPLQMLWTSSIFVLWHDLRQSVWVVWKVVIHILSQPYVMYTIWYPYWYAQLLHHARLWWRIDSVWPSKTTCLITPLKCALSAGSIAGAAVFQYLTVLDAKRTNSC